MHCASLSTGRFYSRTVNLTTFLMLNFWKGETVVVQWWTCELWTGRKEETCVFTHRNNIKEKWHLMPLCTSACIERKQQGVCNFSIIFTFLRQDLNTAQSFLDFEQNKHDRCSLIHYSKTCYSLLIISPLNIINTKFSLEQSSFWLLLRIRHKYSTQSSTIIWYKDMYRNTLNQSQSV